MALRILFVPFGSEGDVNPLFWLADGLAARGHEAVFLLNAHYGNKADARGFRWFPIGTEEEFASLIRNPDLWDRRKGPKTVIQGMLDSLPHYRDAFQQAGTEFDLVVTSSFALAATAIAEAAKLPRITLHFQPICFFSEFDCPHFVTELAWLPRAPRWVKRGFYRVVDLLLWRRIRKPLNAFRAELGLPPFRHFYNEALHGADGVAALFPDWYAPPQLDWPPGLRQFGFPLDPTPQPLPEDLENFLQSGEPPVVWTHGSANVFVREFQKQALAASRELNVRCLLVSLEAPEVPLPVGAFHCAHARFEDLFPRCRAAVHHGGIGTTAKCIAAGRPQLIIPRSHDQPDNAQRIVRLGLGDTLSYRKIHTPALPRVLKKLLDSTSVPERCLEFQKRLASSHSLPDACNWAEQIATQNR